MADQGGDWTSPGGGPQRDQDPPRYGERIPGFTPAPQVPVPVAPQAYTPPPKPGLIPLHPLSFGQLLGAAFQTIRYNPRATIAPALIVSLIQNALTVGVTYGIGLWTVDRVERATTDADRAAITAGGVATGGAAFLAVIVVTVVGTALLQGLITRVVADGALGRRPTMGQALRAAGRRFWPLVGYALVVFVIQLVLVLVLAAAVVGLIAAFSGVADNIGILYAILIALPIGLALVVVYFWIYIKFALTSSIIVLERGRVFPSIARSWRLTRKAFWRTFGLVLLVTIMVSAAGQIVALPFSVIGGALGGLLFPNAGNDVSSTVLTSLVSSAPALIVAVIVAGIGQIAQVSSLVLIYLDRRMRTEGLDLDLQRYVEVGGDDPFERVG
jgi:hypothetical protein